MGLDTGDYWLAPEGTDGTIALIDQLSHVFSSADFGYNDQDRVTYDSDGNPIQWKHYGFSSVKITALDLALGTLTYNGAAVTVGTTISIFQLSNLVYTAPAGTLGAGAANIQFSVTDSNGGIDSTPNTLTIDLVTQNSAPVGTDKTISILEDHFYTLSAADFGFADPNDTAHPNAFFGVWLGGINGHGQFSLDGQGFGADRWVSAANISKLLYTAQANYNGNSGLVLNFNVYDDGGTAYGGVNVSTGYNTVTIKVVSVNDAPTGADNTVSYLEDSGKHVLSADLFGFSDAADSAAPNKLSKVIIDGISGGGTFLLGDTQVKSGDIINASDLGTLTFQAASNGSGDDYASLTFRLVDNGGTANGGIDTETGSHTLTFNIAPVNDAPSGVNKVVTLAEDSGMHVLGAEIFGFSDMTDAAEPDSLAKVIIDEIAGKGTFMLGGAEVHAGDAIDASALASLTFQSATNEFGTAYASLTFRLLDDGGTEHGGLNTETGSHVLTFDVDDVVDRFRGTAARNVLEGTAGQDVLDGRSGKDRLTGLGGSDTFVFSRGYGKDVITDFEAKGADHDTLDLRRLVGVDSFRDLKAHHIEKSGADVVITGNHGDQITLSHVKIGDLGASDFLF